MAKRDQGIHTHRAPRRNPRCGQRHCHQQERDSKKGFSVVRAHTEHQTRNETRRAERPRQPKGNAGER